MPQGLQTKQHRRPRHRRHRKPPDIRTFNKKVCQKAQTAQRKQIFDTQKNASGKLFFAKKLDFFQKSCIITAKFPVCRVQMGNAIPAMIEARLSKVSPAFRQAPEGRKGQLPKRPHRALRGGPLGRRRISAGLSRKWRAVIAACMKCACSHDFGHGCIFYRERTQKPFAGQSALRPPSA